MDTDHPPYTTVLHVPNGWMAVLKVWNPVADDYQIVMSRRYRLKQDARKEALAWAADKHAEVK